MSDASPAWHEGPSWRAGLVRKHALLRGLASGSVPTARAARFAAQARPGTAGVTFTELAVLPMWRLDPTLDRDRLAEIAGLLAARPILLRTVAGPLLRDLAERYSPALLEAVLEAELPDAAPGVAARSLAAAELRDTGQAVLDAATRDDVDARAIADTALLLCTAGEQGLQ